MSTSMVSSADDLLGRCKFATEQNMSMTGTEPKEIILMLGLPIPSRATNSEMNLLKPVYLEIFNDIDIYLQPLFETTLDSPDAAILILYFLEFPIMVRSVRGDVTGLADCKVKEGFELVDIADTIVANAPLGKWCRDALAESNHQKYHGLILASCINLMSAIARLPASRAKKVYRKFALRGNKEGFLELHNDLAAVIGRKDVPADAVLNAIMLQLQVRRIHHDGDNYSQKLPPLPRNQDFIMALERIRGRLDDHTYQQLRGTLRIHMSVQELFTWEDGCGSINSEKPVCEANGCTALASKVCSGCRLVSYCTKECQVSDWKAGHKQKCKTSKKQTSNSAGVAAAAEAARQRGSPALQAQDKLLASNPGVAYIVVMPSGNDDMGLNLPFPRLNQMFKSLRAMAPSSPNAVSRMYSMLADDNPDLKDIIRRQLQAEYGLDPLSREAKNAPLQYQ